MQSVRERDRGRKKSYFKNQGQRYVRDQVRLEMKIKAYKNSNMNAPKESFQSWYKYTALVQHFFFFVVVVF